MRPLVEASSGRTSTLPVTGALLAGGLGLRLGGTLKAELRYRGETLLSRGLRFLGGLCSEVVLLPGPHRFDVDVRQLPDAPDGRGAPGALLAALEATRLPWVFALGVDMPAPLLATARSLFARMGDADAICYVREGRLEPLYAFYSFRCGPIFRRRLERGGASFGELLSLVTARRIPIAAGRTTRYLDNVNTEAEAARLGIDVSFASRTIAASAAPAAPGRAGRPRAPRASRAAAAAPRRAARRRRAPRK